MNKKYDLLDSIDYEDGVIKEATEILYNRLISGPNMSSPEIAIDFLKMKLSPLEHERFGVLFLNNKNMVINYEDLFIGTIDQAAVYPREVMKKVLFYNASSIIIAHNHPSGDPRPSDADIVLTKKLIDALKYIDVKVLDHIVVSVSGSVSLMKEGLI